MLDELFGKPAFHGFQKLTDRVFVYFSYVNSTVILADDGVCVIDSQVNTGQVRRLYAEIKKLTPLPIKWLINTHYHWDHVIGNRFFKEQGATIYAHDLTRHFLKTRMKRQWAFLKGRGFTMEDPEPTLPDVTFTGEMNLSLPGINLQLRHLGPTESDDATAIYMPRENLMCTGDTLLTGSFPIFGMATMNEGLGEDRAWLGVLKSIEQLNPKNMIPGHGPLGTHADLQLMVRVQNFFLDSVEKYVNDGLPLPEIQKRIHQDLPEDIRKLPEVWGTVNYAIYRCYHSFTGWMDYKPTAIPWAHDEMLAQALVLADHDLAQIEAAVEKAMGEKQHGLALSLSRHLTVQDSQNPQAHALLAECLMEAARTTSSILEKGDFFSLAKHHLDDALELDPGHPLALLVKGMFNIVRAEKNGTDPLEGIEMLERAAKAPQLTDKRRAKIQFGLTLAYFQTGRFPEAMAACQKAVQFDPQFYPAKKLLEEMPRRLANPTIKK